MVRTGRLPFQGMLTLDASRDAGHGAAGTSFPGFVCPRCRDDLWQSEQAYHCRACAADYPVVLGIPDFRVEPDPWIGLEEDRAKARRVAQASASGDLEGAVRSYWGMTPGTPRHLAERFTAHVLAGEQRAREWLAHVHGGESTARTGPSRAPQPWLEIGCGTGDLLAAAADEGIPVVGVDVAMRWLVIARRRAQLSTGAQLLVCCNAEHLPFRDKTFAQIVSVCTLEHCRDAAAVAKESGRVLSAGGAVHLKTVNRYAPLAEPHVGVWGVGYVPRRWADCYVRWRSGQRYLYHRPLSRRELSVMWRKAGFGDVRVAGASLLSSERARIPPRARWLAALYGRLCSSPATRAAMSWIAPLLEARGTKPSGTKQPQREITDV